MAVATAGPVSGNPVSNGKPVCCLHKDDKTTTMEDIMPYEDDHPLDGPHPTDVRENSSGQS